MTIANEIALQLESLLKYILKFAFAAAFSHMLDAEH